MSHKLLDHKGRWRNVTVAFRVSPEEAKQLNIYSKLSGLTKQDYLTSRVLVKDIVVNPNPRVFKALRNQLASVLSELQRLEKVCADNEELLELVRHIAGMMYELKGDENAQQK